MQDACRRRLSLPSVKLRTNVSRETYAEKKPADGALVPGFCHPFPWRWSFAGRPSFPPDSALPL